jgi:ribosomal protein L44E
MYWERGEMTQHYQRNTTEVMAFCPTCGRNTMHRVDSGRRGPCLEDHRQGMSVKQQKQKEKQEADKDQGKLF